MKLKQFCGGIFVRIEDAPEPTRWAGARQVVFAVKVQSRFEAAQAF